MTSKTINRRTLLKGLGVSIALPWLEAMDTRWALAANPPRALPKRMAFFYVPNGVHMPDWTPSALGANFELPRILRPLQPFKNDLLVLSGLTLDKARPNGDGAGDHARAMASFLTGCQARKTNGSDIRVGVSVDQVAARHLGNATRFGSLELGCEGGRLAGNCDSGYSCAYSNSISWRSESSPNPKETNPRLVFDRLFGNQNGANRQDQYNQSILDFVTEDARSLLGRLGTNDRRRMDEYLTSIRDIERRINQAQNRETNNRVGLARPAGIPAEMADHVRIMGDLMALAFQADLTRVTTFVFANEGSNRSYRMINIPDGHHDLSHHQGNQEKQDKIARINLFHMTQFAYIVERLKNIREGEGTLLDNCMLVYGSGNGDGNRHNHDDLPVLVVGKGGGTFRTGRHIRFPRETPLMNLYLSMLDRVGLNLPRHGDSTGRLPSLT